MYRKYRGGSLFGNTGTVQRNTPLKMLGNNRSWCTYDIWRNTQEINSEEIGNPIRHRHQKSPFPHSWMKWKPYPPLPLPPPKYLGRGCNMLRLLNIKDLSMYRQEYILPVSSLACLIVKGVFVQLLGNVCTWRTYSISSSRIFVMFDSLNKCTIFTLSHCLLVCYPHLIFLSYSAH